jgi:hypothetical protein
MISFVGYAFVAVGVWLVFGALFDFPNSDGE